MDFCDSASFVESSSKPYTWCICDDEVINDACVSIELPGVSLLQAPSESLDIEYTSRYYCDVDDAHHLNKYNLRLLFRNNVHELCQDYGYELIGNALISPTREAVGEAVGEETRVLETKPYHQLLFAHRRTRFTGIVEISEIFCVRRSRLVHLCFGIRRSNGQRDVGAEIESHAEMLLRTGVYSDVRFKVGERTFPAHKHLLSSSSPVFQAMFAHGQVFPENRTNGTVVIDDLDPDVIEQLLTHIYTGRAPKLGSMPRALFVAAHRYELAELQRACQEFFVFRLNRENVVEILELCELYELRELRERAMGFIRNHEADMVLEQSFRSFLCRNFRLDGIAETLRISLKYQMEEVKAEAMEFVKQHSKDLATCEEFLGLFRTHPDLMREIFVYVHR